MLFDSNYYLRDNNKSVLVKKTYNVVPMRCNTYNITEIESDDTKKEIVVSTPVTYLDKVVEYMKRKVYPVTTLETISSIDTIHQLINDNLDIAFVNEETLLRYYNEDCNYLKAYLNDNYRSSTEIENNQDYTVKPLNFSVISTAFYQDMYLFVPVNSQLRYFWDFASIRNQKIGVFRDSYYYFGKLMRYIIDKTFRNMDDIEIEIYDDPDKMIQDFKDEEINGFFIVSHPKNQVLLKLTKENEVRLLHLQKRPEDKTNEEEEDEKFQEFGDCDMTMEERLDTLTNEAKNVPDMKNDFNIIIKLVFQILFQEVLI